MANECMRRATNRSIVRAIPVVFFALIASVHAQTAAPRTNVFNDPFVQVTNGIAACSVPEGPGYTAEEARKQEHYRVERGTSCFRAGRCRLPNAYLYDQEIIPRVQKAILTDGRFGNTSVWVEGQRRWVTLQGCVHSAAESEALERLVRNIDDVEAVINELVVR
jgi:hypothetical protein